MSTLQQKINQTIVDVIDFPKEGIVYKDITPLFLNPELSDEIVDAFVEIAKGKVDVVCGIESRGFLYGIQMPIIEMHSKYIGSALYDELIEIEATVHERDKGVRIRFDYNIYSEAGKLINQGYTILCCIDAETRRPIRIPERIWTSLG